MLTGYYCLFLRFTFATFDGVNQSDGSRLFLGGRFQSIAKGCRGFFLSIRKLGANKGNKKKNEMVDRGLYLVAQGNQATATIEPCQLFSKGHVTLAATSFCNHLFWCCTEMSAVLPL